MRAINKGWENIIIGNSKKGMVEQRNIKGILKNAMKAYNKWILHGKNKGKNKDNFHNSHNRVKDWVR